MKWILMAPQYHFFMGIIGMACLWIGIATLKLALWIKNRLLNSK